jgi:transcriptional regulator with XRE-family HTH domain
MTGADIRAMRESLGWSYAQMADALGLSTPDKYHAGVSAIRRLEANGLRPGNIRDDVIRKRIDALKRKPPPA